MSKEQAGASHATGPSRSSYNSLPRKMRTSHPLQASELDVTDQVPGPDQQSLKQLVQREVTSFNTQQLFQSAVRSAATKSGFDETFSEDFMNGLKPESFAALGDSAEAVWSLYHQYLEISQQHPKWPAILVGHALELTKDTKDVKKAITMLLVLTQHVADVADALREYEARNQQRIKQIKLERNLSSNTYRTLAMLGDAEDSQVDELTFSTLADKLQRSAGLRAPDIALRIGLKFELWQDGTSKIKAKCDAIAKSLERAVARSAAAEAQRMALEAEKQAEVVQKIAPIRHDYKVQVEAKALGNGGRLAVDGITANPKLDQELEKAGLAIIKAAMRTTIGGGQTLSNKNHDILERPGYFLQNTALCGAYVKEAKVFEVYKVQRTNNGFGWLELETVLEDIRDIPSNFKGVRLQAFRAPEGELCEEIPKGLFKLTKKYQPIHLESGEAETMVEKALAARGIKGGCWNTITKGHLPKFCDNNLSGGVRTAPLAVAVAGMATFFDSSSKRANWIEFPEIRLAAPKDRVLVLGHCEVDASQGAGRKKVFQNRVKVIAAKDSRIWTDMVMWGLS